MSLRTQNIHTILFGTRSKIPHTPLNKSKNNRRATDQQDSSSKLAQKQHNPNVRKSGAQNKAVRTERNQSVSLEKGKIIPKTQLTSYGAMQKDFEKKTSRLAEIHCHHGNTSFDKNLVRNVLAFVQLLPKYRSDRIDQDVFIALLSQRFNLTNMYLIKCLFSVLVQGRVIGSQDVEKINKNRELAAIGTLSVETLATFLCALLADNVEAKSDVVFNVFDHKWSRSISRADLYYILAPMFDEMNKITPQQDTNFVDEEEIGKDKDFLIQCVVDKLDANGDDDITLEEFTSMAKIDRSVMYFFGPLLPDDKDVDKFRAMLTDKSPFIVKSEFRDERRRLLRSPETNRSFIQSFYPVELEGL